MNEDYFDFEEKFEEDVEADFNHAGLCLHCNRPIPKDALFCLYCGEPVSLGKKSKWLVWTALILLVVFILLMVI